MKTTNMRRLAVSSSLSVFLAGCGAPNYGPSQMHINAEEEATKAPKSPRNLPKLVRTSPTTPLLHDTAGAETFDVVVTNVPVRDLLFALARDAGVNMDVDSRVGGVVSISALDQTLDAILERISRQVDIRIERLGETIIVKPDEAYHKKYRIDFVNIARTYSSSATGGGVGNTGSSSISNTSGSDFWQSLESGVAAIISTSGEEGDSVFEENENADRLNAAQDSESLATGEFGSYYYHLNQEAGILLVFAPERLQEEIREYLDVVTAIAKRQVLLEATVVEVILSNQYKQGIDWSFFNSLATDGLALYQGANVGGAAAALSFIVDQLDDQSIRRFNDVNEDGVITSADGDSVYNAYLSFIGGGDILSQEGVEGVVSYDTEPLPRIDAVAEVRDTTTGAITTPRVEAQSARVEVARSIEGTRINRDATVNRAGGLSPASPAGDNFITGAYRSGDISAAVELLDRFGDAKILSSPRISALNNQPALLRVVDQEVYFNIEVDESVDSQTGQVTSRDFTVSENTVDVGFSMNVLPQISEAGEIILNLKPAVTRVLDYRRAPTPAAFGGGGNVQNLVPITRVRELESILSLRDGEVGVLGGLLEDRVSDDDTAVPGLSKLPGVGALFERKDQQTFKTEFVVFIRASIIKNPTLHGDYSEYRGLLPTADFLTRERTNTFLPPAQERGR